MPKPSNGLILYEGPSLLDGEPIVMIGTGYAKGSQNVKTGAMIQTWILRSDLPPVEAIKSGQDSSICGDCVLRGAGDGTKRGCYVNVYWAPGRVFDTYRKGGYPRPDSLAGAHAGKVVRLGSYGDPAAVPRATLAAIVEEAESWTGYTHQWRESDLQDLCMASVESGAQALDAQARGYRTFRTLQGVGGKEKGEILCPASKEGGFKTTCEKCRLCDGSRVGQGSVVDRRANIAIVVHGAGKRSAGEVIG
jgi:hypothetical protein